MHFFVPGRSSLSIVLVAIALLPVNVLAEDWKPIELRLPPKGIDLPQQDRQRLEQRSEQLKKVIGELNETPRRSSDGVSELLPDIAIFSKALDLALQHNEFYKPEDVKLALDVTQQGLDRAKALAQGKSPWVNQKGLVVRGYRSAVDGSVQPYGLVIPEKLNLNKPSPLYVWLHGRGDKETDLHFISNRMKKAGEVKPDDAIVLHPFGRHCLGWKSTAEIDVLEAIASVESRYKIDPDRIVLMGFSMGGAGAWHIGAHYTDRFCAVHAGAGFGDVKRYQRLKPEQYPAAHEQTLWHVYDVPDYVRNLFNVPVIAYSGEEDKQKDVADMMAEVYQQHGQELTHLIGPGMGHKYHPGVLKDIMAKVAQAVERGRPNYPREVTLQTRTLRYNRMYWVEILGLEQHWEDSRVDAKFHEDGGLEVQTKNVSMLRLKLPESPTRVTIDSKAISEPASGTQVFYKHADSWIAGTPPETATLRKKPGLQGPIDDVLLEPFLVVLPSGKSKNEKVQQWLDFELDHFQSRWRSVYRGELRMKKDSEVTADDLKSFHLILWGDPGSNRAIAKLKDKLPIHWGAEQIQVGDQIYAASNHVPLLIYPNPLQPDKYIVLNSGPTHREAHDRTNSLQNPKLPDWAIIDVTVPPSDSAPGKVVDADFFDELWQLKK